MKRAAFAILLASSFMISCKKYFDFFHQPEQGINKLYGGSDADFSRHMVASIDGGFVTAANTDSKNGDVSTNHGKSDFWVFKIDRTAKIIWQKTYGGTDEDVPSTICSSADGGYIVAGRTLSNDLDVSGYHGNQDAWIIKVNSKGDLSWQKTLGGSGVDGIESITTNEAGEIIAVGYSSSKDGDVSQNRGSYDIWIIKLSADGNLIWQKTFGGLYDDFARSVIRARDGSFVLVGDTESFNGDFGGPFEPGHFGRSDAFMMKLDNDGNIKWKTRFGSSENDFPETIIMVPSGGYMVGGATSGNNFEASGNLGGSDGWLVRLDDNGKVLWHKTYGGSEFDATVALISIAEGGYLMTAVTNSNDKEVSGNHGGNSDAWVVRLTDNGSIVWQKCFGGSLFDAFYSINNFPGNGFIMTGISQSNDGDVSGNHGGSSDVWILSLKK